MVNNNLRVWRAKFDMTQGRLAKRVGVSRQTIIAIEKGSYNPSVELALKIAKTFNTRVDEIFYLKGEE